MTFPILQHFAESEFKHPERMDPAFLQWLDKVRHATGAPFHLTSDARTPEENAAASGSSATSLHLQGRAVDFVLTPWDRETLWNLTCAVVLVPAAVGKELELVQGPTDKHVHIGLFPDVRPSRLVLNVT